MTHDLTHFITPIGITRLASSAALAGSFWAATRGKRCPTCQMASGLSGGLPLGRIGTPFYLLVLASTFLPGSAPTAWALAGAAGIHAVLAGLLLRHRIICLTCLATAAAVLLGASAAIVVDPAGNLPAAFAAPLAAVAGWFGIGVAARRGARRSMQQAERLLAEFARNEPPVEPGKVKVVVLSRPQCGACDFLKEAVLPELEREFAGVMEVQHRTAGAGTPAPTLLILGKSSLPFIGAAPAEVIASSIRMALGRMPEPVVVTSRERERAGASRFLTVAAR